MALPIAGDTSPTSEQSEKEAFAFVEEQLNSDPAPSWLGVQLVSAGVGEVVMRLPVQPEMNNALGLLHGGFVFLLADTAFAYCDTAAGTPLVTHMAHTTYLAPVQSAAWIQAQAVVQHRYGRNVMCDVTVTDSRKNVIAEMRVHGVMARAKQVVEP
jgi:acyl-CoA thioesterase